MHNLLKFITLSIFVISFTACGSGDSSSQSNSSDINNINDVKYSIDYKGLYFYAQNTPLSGYKLQALSDAEFNELNSTTQIQVADKLLSSLFFGYSSQELNEKIAKGTFLTDLAKNLQKDTTDKSWLEAYIKDENIFTQNQNEQEALDILTRFYAAKELDRYFFHNWIAYILTQTIMFSPAYELESSHNPNIARVYNRLVFSLEEEFSLAYISYIHMMSEDNWRRFRSPEDNGREMLEIFTNDRDDSKVPLAGKALQNWKLNRDNDTLVVTLNENREALNLFNTTIYNGDDFYREMVKSEAFENTVVQRLVSFFFTDSSRSTITSVSNSILQSNPKSWQDILTQILFSKEYLLHTSRAKSAEETFFSLSKKLAVKHRKTTIYSFKYALEAMHQASMKYKLGKIKRVPLDTLSFANYHKSVRDELLLRRSDPKYSDDYNAWQRQGWSDSFIADENFGYNYQDEEASLVSFINYLFVYTISREANTQELEMLKRHMLKEKNGVMVLHSAYDMFTDRDNRESRKRNIAYTVLDYLSRVDAMYTYKEVN